MGKEKYIVALLLCTPVIFGFGGCSKPSAGEENQSPQNISPGGIADFYAEFFLADRWTLAENHNFLFRIAPDENGTLTVYEHISQISHPADADITVALQKIIADYNLWQMNGADKITPGLAPTHQKCSLTVNYTNGDKLQFSVNNDPHAQWAQAMYGVFADWFAARGEHTLYPQNETSLPVSVSIRYMAEGKTYSYTTISDTATDRCRIKKSVYDNLLKKNIREEYVQMPDDYFETAGKIISSYNIVRMYDFSRYDHFAKDYGNHSRGYYGMGVRTAADERDSENTSFRLTVKFHSGKTVNISTSKPSELDGMTAFITELAEYHSSVF